MGNGRDPRPRPEGDDTRGPARRRGVVDGKIGAPAGAGLGMPLDPGLPHLGPHDNGRGEARPGARSTISDRRRERERP